MTDRQKEIKDTYLKLLSLTETAKVYGISKQRVHQIVRNYLNTGRHARLKKYRRSWDRLCANCSKRYSQALHHIDGNNKNESVINLLPLCVPCHGIYHRGGRHITKRAIVTGRITLLHN